MSPAFVSQNVMMLLAFAHCARQGQGHPNSAQMVGEWAANVCFRDGSGAQIGLERRAIDFDRRADQFFERVRQSEQGIAEVTESLDGTKKAPGLFDGSAGEGERIGVE